MKTLRGLWTYGSKGHSGQVAVTVAGTGELVATFEREGDAAHIVGAHNRMVYDQNDADRLYDRVVK
jgi:hypothetical protein